jgi:dTDP-glucose 4,6-dehydratase
MPQNHMERGFEGKRFYHISTDEVYGSLGAEGLFTETTAYDPNSPYSIQSEFRSFCESYGETYGLPYVLTNCSKIMDLFIFLKS